MEQGERALYIISVAAELAGVHPQTLRIYERKGLIEPARTQGRSRRYSDRDIALLRRIQELTNEGVSLVGVRKIIDLEDDLARAYARIRELEQALDRAHDELVEAVNEAHRQHRRDLVPVSRAVVRVARGLTLRPLVSGRRPWLGRPQFGGEPARSCSARSGSSRTSVRNMRIPSTAIVTFGGRDDVGRARLAVEQRELAEVVAVASRGRARDRRS